jgi:hypothetical protein
MTIKEFLDDIERFAVGYLQTGDETLFDAVQTAKMGVFKQFYELETRNLVLETENKLLIVENTDYVKVLIEIILNETVTREQMRVWALTAIRKNDSEG